MLAVLVLYRRRSVSSLLTCHDICTAGERETKTDKVEVRDDLVLAGLARECLYVSQLSNLARLVRADKMVMRVRLDAREGKGRQGESVLLRPSSILSRVRLARHAG